MKGKAKILTMVSITALGALGGLISCDSNNANASENYQNNNIDQFFDANKNRLATPKLSISENYLYWNKIPHADYYQIYMNNQFWKVSLEPQQEFDIGVNGEYIFQIEAKSLDEQYSTSAKSNQVTYTVNRKRLAYPIITIKNGVVSWKAIDGATSYEIYINGFQTTITPDIKIQNNICYWALDENVQTACDIYVVSKSNRSDYETNSSNSNTVKVNLTDRKTWNAKKLVSETENDLVTYSNQSVIFEKDGYVSTYFNVDKNYCYLFIEKSTSSNNFTVKINGETLSSATFGAGIFRYDLNKYRGRGVNLTILANAKDSISSISLRKKNKASPLTRWESDDITKEWSSFGTTVVHNEGFCLENNGTNSGIINELLVSGNKRFLSFGVRKFIRSGVQDQDAKLKVYVNNSVIKAIDSVEDYILVNSDTFTTFIFDLSAYLDQVVNIKIENVQGEHACINKIWFGTKGNYSISTYWDASFIEEEWSFGGDVKIHTEGVCLENNGSEASLSNDVLIQKRYFKLSFRKFIRSGAQDLDPKIIIKINNTLVKANGVNTDYVTATTDEYSPFIYDLSLYSNQVVKIQIINIEGEHACFNELSLID